jgi:hypothetical protein
VSTALLAVAVLWWAFAEGPLRDPEEALRDFYAARDRAEDQLMDPLILKGSGVVPLVLAEVQDRDMRLRRYAIGFLGRGRYRAALPVLERIVGDATELHYFRAGALEAIYQINQDRARAFAPRYVESEGLLGEVARTIAAGGNPVWSRRSWWQAFRHVHE